MASMQSDPILPSPETTLMGASTPVTSLTPDQKAALLASLQEAIQTIEKHKGMISGWISSKRIPARFTEAKCQEMVAEHDRLIADYQAYAAQVQARS